MKKKRAGFSKWLVGVGRVAVPAAGVVDRMRRIDLIMSGNIRESAKLSAPCAAQVPNPSKDLSTLRSAAGTTDICQGTLFHVRLLNMEALPSDLFLQPPKEAPDAYYVDSSVEALTFCVAEVLLELSRNPE